MPICENCRNQITISQQKAFNGLCPKCARLRDNRPALTELPELKPESFWTQVKIYVIEVIVSVVVLIAILWFLVDTRYIDILTAVIIFVIFEIGIACVILKGILES